MSVTSAAVPALGDEELIRRFEDSTLSEDQFHHRQHVRMVWLLLRRERMAIAADRFIEGLKRLVASLGKPSLYHETITWAFLLLINERMCRRHAATWEEFAAANPDLLTWHPSILDRYYTREMIGSELARRTFIMPAVTDRAFGVAASLPPGSSASRAAER